MTLSLTDTFSTRNDGRVIKVKVGTAITDVQVEYVPDPKAQDDGYYAARANVPAWKITGGQGVLQNDISPRQSTLTAEIVTGLSGLSLDPDGGFTYDTPASAGPYSFTYRADDGTTKSTPATAMIQVAPENAYVVEDFANAGDLANWIQRSGSWVVRKGALVAGPNGQGYATAYRNATWTDYSIEARINFGQGAYSGGIGGRLQSDGARYGVWIYPDDSTGGCTVALVRFTGWESWTGTFLDSKVLANAGSGWHTLRVRFQGNFITVFHNDAQVIGPHEDLSLSSGGVSLDMWTDGPESAYTMSLDYVIVKP